MKVRQPVNISMIIAAGAVIIIIVAAWGIFAVLEEYESAVDEPETHILSEMFYNGEDPLEEQLISWLHQNMSRIEINVLLNSRYELVFKGAITGEESEEILITEKDPFLPTPDQALRREGFTQTIRGLILYRIQEESLLPVLVVTADGMYDKTGNQLLAQTSARHGYSWQISDAGDHAFYEQAVRLIDVIMLDERGRAASDEITLYPDPGSGLYRATNTFGAPGTFSGR